MRITSWSIIFVIIVFAFSFSNRMLIENKSDILMEEVRYNNAVDLSTMDSTQSIMENMINLGNENRETFYTVLKSADTFFESFSLTLGYYGGSEKENILKSYIPALAILANDGFYICSLEELQRTTGGSTYNYSEHMVKPKVPYAVEDKTQLITREGATDKIVTPPDGIHINYTMDNTVKVYGSTESYETTFDYTGNMQQVQLNAGTYKLEVWGAEGGHGSTNSASLAGKGGYSYGTLTVPDGETVTLYIAVGGKGVYGAGSSAYGGPTGGWNGGGAAGNATSGSGGGATHIALVSGQLKDLSAQKDKVLLVAGGGGGADNANGTVGGTDDGAGGAGGGLTGGAYLINGVKGSGGGTQTSGYAFGLGASVTVNTDSGGGGGGWYGGNVSNEYNGGGAGGSGYVSSTLKNGGTVAGDKSMPSPIGGTQIGQTGNGYVKITGLSNTKTILEGEVVDIRHYEDLNKNDGETGFVTEKLADGTEVLFKWQYLDAVYSKEGTYNGKNIYYEKSFYMLNGVRYLYEEWYIDEELVDRRTSKYTEAAYNFTMKLSQLGKIGAATGYYEMEGNYLTQGNPENRGSKDPFTGVYTIGEFYKVKNKAILDIVKQSLSEYILVHNKYLELSNVSYTFALPNITDEEWERAISDVSVLAFVQGMPILGQEYYNNYGISGAQIVDREIFYGYPGTRYTLQDSGILPGDDDFPTYYSSYEFPSDLHYLLDVNGARIYYSAQAAANDGYFPNIHSNSLISELEMDVLSLRVDLEYHGNTQAGKTAANNNQTGRFGATGTTTYDPVVLTYYINRGSSTSLQLKEAKYMYFETIGNNPSTNRMLNSGIQILPPHTNYNPDDRVGTFTVTQNGAYRVAAREMGGTAGKSNEQLVINVFESGTFSTDVDVQVGYSIRDNTGRRYASLTLTGNGTPIFSSVTYNRSDGKAVNTKDTIVIPQYNASYGSKPIAYIHIYDNGKYVIDTVNGYGDLSDKDTVDIAIPNLPPIVELSMTPTEKTTPGTKAYDSVSKLTCTPYTETYLYKQGTETLKVTAKFGDEDIKAGNTTVVDPYTAVWTHWYKASSTSGWENLGNLTPTNDSYSTKTFDVGTHRVYVTATDIYGASTTSYIEFIVAEYIDTVNLKDWYVYDHYKNQSTYNSSGRVNSPYNVCSDYGFGLPYHISTGTRTNGQNFVRFDGYPQYGYTDYMIYPSNLSGKRLINFTIVSNEFYPHTLSSAGVYINAGIVNNSLTGYRISYYPSGRAVMNRINISGPNLNKTVNISGWGAVMNIEIEITQTNVIVKQKVSTASNYTVVLNETLTPTGYNGFGPFASYSGHNCSEHSYITFENIRMTRISN